jgi:UDP-glucose 4-epimerase
LNGKNFSMDLKGRVALVTGGAGFVGSHVVDALAQEGTEVRVVDNFTRGGAENLAWARAHGSVSLMEGDIRQAALWDKALPGADVVFHQAALRVNRCEENPQECWEVMVDATLTLLRACVRHGVKKVIIASSAIVYGAADVLPTPEGHHLNHNATWYGAAKVANEQMLNVFAARGELAGVALRYFNIYGPRMAVQGHTEVLVKWLQALDQGKPLRIFGDGTQTMDWVDVRDVARANVLAARAGVSHGVFNVGTGQETSLRELGRMTLKAAGKAEEPELVPQQAPLNPIPRRWADISLARKILGFESRISLEEGLGQMVRWWKNLRSLETGPK